MATAVRQTEERVAEVRRRAEDAVNQVRSRKNLVVDVSCFFTDDGDVI